MTSKDLKFEWAGLHPFSYHPFVFDLIPDLKGRTVLDCGCGKGVYGYLIRATRDTTGSKLIGLDLNPKRLAFCRRFRVYDKLVKSDITRLPFKDNSVDFLICSEVIEHLSKTQGEKFLKEVNRVVKSGGRALITTPHINMDTLLGGADAHYAIWTPGDFRNHGYKVKGMGLKIPHGYGNWYTKLVLGLSHTFSSISYFFPNLAGYLIAYKDF